jgi:hypothetical protein
MDAGTNRADAPPGSGERPHSPVAGTDCDGGRALEAYARSIAAVFDDEWLNALEPRQGGHEHETYVDPDAPEWRIKVTGPNLMLLSGRRRFPAFTFAMYLESWRLANLVFEDRAEFLGVIPTEDGARLVIRQPEVEAADPDNPHPMKPEICTWLRSAGFEYDEGAWVRDEDLVVLSDEHEGNFIVTDAGVRPIDLHLRRLAWASGPVIPWSRNPANPHRELA